MLILSSLMTISLSVGMYYYAKQYTIQQLTAKEKLEAQVREEQPGQEPLQPISSDEAITYSLQNEVLNITYDSGKSWTKVPIKKELLFKGEYNGNEQELMENSYLLNNKLAAFLYMKGPDLEQNQLLLTYSRDKGKTWQDTVIADNIVALRFRKVRFLTENFGYVIFSPDRTMSAEVSTVYLTNDGGNSWQETVSSNVTRLISDGGFINESTGFLSFGTINPEEPDVYVTEDGGNTWSSSVFHIPDKYKRIFVTAEVPFTEGDHLGYW